MTCYCWCLQYVERCFNSASLFHKALKEAFEAFCNKPVAGSQMAELMANYCNALLKKVGYRAGLHTWPDKLRHAVLHIHTAASDSAPPKCFRQLQLSIVEVTKASCCCCRVARKSSATKPSRARWRRSSSCSPTSATRCPAAAHVYGSWVWELLCHTHASTQAGSLAAPASTHSESFRDDLHMP